MCIYIYTYIYVHNVDRQIRQKTSVVKKQSLSMHVFALKGVWAQEYGGCAAGRASRSAAQGFQGRRCGVF